MVLEPEVRRYGTGRTRASLIKGDTHKALANCAVKPLFSVYCALRIRWACSADALGLFSLDEFCLLFLGHLFQVLHDLFELSMVKFTQSTMYNKSIYIRVLVFSLNCNNPPIVLTAGLFSTDRVPLTGKRGYSCAVVGWYR